MLNKKLIVKDEFTRHELNRVIGYLETLNAVMTLEYHDKNHLDTQLVANPGKMNQMQRELVRFSLDVLGTTAVT